MKRMVFLTILTLSSLTLFSQIIDLKYIANTGDAEFDLTLADLNVQAKADLDGFKAELSVSYGTSEDEIGHLLDEKKLEPADVYMALELTNIVHKPLDTVVQYYVANKDEGWGYIARVLGIKPGSQEFKALKSSSSERTREFKGKAKGKSKK